MPSSRMDKIGNIPIGILPRKKTGSELELLLSKQISLKTLKLGEKRYIKIFREWAL